jgi:hypothetical protein
MVGSHSYESLEISEISQGPNFDPIPMIWQWMLQAGGNCKFGHCAKAVAKLQATEVWPACDAAKMDGMGTLQDRPTDRPRKLTAWNHHNLVCVNLFDVFFYWTITNDPIP